MTNTQTQAVTSSQILDAMTVSVPEGKRGNVEVRRFTVSKEAAQFASLRAIFQGGRGSVSPGEYTALYRSGSLWMSDTSDEKWDHLTFVRQCHFARAETVLINGLGLGMVAAAMAVLPSVRVVEACEIDTDVIDLVAPHLAEVLAAAGKELKVTQGDAFTPATTFPKGSRWDACWHDIWATICADDYEEHKLIRRRFGRRVGFQGVWCAEEVRRIAR